MLKLIGRGAAGVVGAVAIWAGTGIGDDNTTRGDRGTIVEAGGLGAFSIREGDCLNLPDAAEVQSVEGVPCSAPHSAEAFHLFDMSDAAYPGEFATTETAKSRCHLVFASYVGTSFDESEFGVAWLTPSSATWETGDREIVCVLGPVDGATTIGSAKGSKR